MIETKEEMLKQLVRQVSVYTSGEKQELTIDSPEEVLFESDIDGMHYYLIRCRAKESDRITLSPRERAIAQLVAQGLDNKSIGKKLGITHWTVATYLRRIFGKLGVTSRTAMTAKLLGEHQLFECD
jgi:two-component system, NarL family, nitrate/nitrite response regulator NarL